MSFYTIILLLLGQLIPSFVGASVVRGSGLCQAEKEFFLVRMDTVRSCQETLGLDSETPLVCGVACSGGGVRSMVYKTGVFAGLDRIGASDLVTYEYLLSGSAWGSLALRPHLPVSHQSEAVVGGFFDKYGRLKSFKHVLAKSFVQYVQECKSQQRKRTAHGMYTIFLKNMLFDDKKRTVATRSFSDLAPLMRTGKLPLPLISAIAVEDGSLDWYEFTPFSVANIGKNGSIPMALFGQKFFNGNLVGLVENHAEPQLLDLLAMTASAYVRTWEALFKEMGSGFPRLASFLEKCMREEVRKKHPFSGLRAPNFMYGLEGCEQPDIILSDPNFRSSMLNFPYPLIARRSHDVLFFIDASTYPEGQLEKVADLAKQMGMPFQEIQTKGLVDRMVTVFDENLNAPIVIYIPIVRTIKSQLQELKDAHDVRLKDQRVSDLVGYICTSDICLEKEMHVSKGIYRTVNFQYKDSQSRYLSSVGELCILLNKEKIFDVMRLALERKKS